MTIEIDENLLMGALGLLTTVLLALFGYLYYLGRKNASIEEKLNSIKTACEKDIKRIDEQNKWLLALVPNAQKNLEKIQQILNDVEKSDNLSREDAKKLFEELVQELNLPTNLDKPPEQWKSAIFEQLFSKSQELNTKNAEIYFQKGNDEFFNNNYSEASNWYRKAVEIKPDNYDAWNNWGALLGILAEKKKNEAIFKQAFEKIQNAIKIKPDFHEAYDNWGTLLGNLAGIKQDEILYRESFEKFQKAIKIKPDDHTPWFNWGTYLGKFGAQTQDVRIFQESFEKFQKAIKIKPDDNEAWHNWGATVGMLGELTQDASIFLDSFKKFQKAIEIEPGEYKPWNTWGANLIHLSHLVEENEREAILTEGLEKCQKAEKLKPGAGAYNIACVYSLKNDVENALGWLRKGFELRGEMQSREHIDNDKDLDNIRHNPRFIRILDNYRPQE